MKKMNLIKAARAMVKANGMSYFDCLDILEKILSEIQSPSFDKSRTESYWKINTGIPVEFLTSILA